MSNDAKGFTCDQYEMLQKWTQFVEAAGLYNSAQHPVVHFTLAGQIMNDAVVRQRWAERVVAGDYAHDPEFPGVVDEGLYLDILRNMTAAEKVALKDRIVAALGIAPPQRITRRNP